MPRNVKPKNPNRHVDPYRRQLVEAGEEFIEGHDQLLGRALGGQAGETLDVGKQDTEDAIEKRREDKHVEVLTSATGKL